MKKEDFGKTSKGMAHLYYLENGNGMKAVVTDFGATLVQLWVPDKNHVNQDVVWGYEKAQQYEDNPPFFGATIGRFGNRISKASFKLNGETYKLVANEKENSLHGGTKGYNIRMWEAHECEDKRGDGVTFSLISPHMDQGYPGEFKVKVTYCLGEDNTLWITYDGVSDKDTFVSMTNHSYFNLDGADSKNVLDQVVEIKADKYMETDVDLIPTGALKAVENTPLDFRIKKVLGRDIRKKHPSLDYGNGYDLNYILNPHKPDEYVASMESEKTGIRMEVLTDLPCMQLYSGNYIMNQTGGKNGRIYEDNSAAAFETQGYVDAPNHPEFPSALLKTGENYKTSTGYHFTTI